MRRQPSYLSAPPHPPAPPLSGYVMSFRIFAGVSYPPAHIVFSMRIGALPSLIKNMAEHIIVPFKKMHPVPPSHFLVKKFKGPHPIIRHPLIQGLSITMIWSLSRAFPCHSASGSRVLMLGEDRSLIPLRVSKGCELRLCDRPLGILSLKAAPATPLNSQNRLEGLGITCCGHTMSVLCVHLQVKDFIRMRSRRFNSVCG
jgi:hypothetical protein